MSAEMNALQRMTSVQIPFFELLSHLPDQHPKGLQDVGLGIGAIILFKLVLITPHHGSWRLFRTGIASPFLLTVFGYLMICPIEKEDIVHWGTPILLFMFCMRVIEYLIFFPPEEYCHRMVPTSNLHPNFKPPRSRVRFASDTQTSTSTSTNCTKRNQHDRIDEGEADDDRYLVAEPVPPPFTLSKLYWASSLFWSFRGIGWNFECPLPDSSISNHPYRRDSSRSSWIVSQMKIWLIRYLIDDFLRSIRNIVARDFFAGRQSYDSLSTFQMGLYSVAVVSRISFGMVNSWIGAGIPLVVLGGIMGWKGEIWEPWGWPPLYGSVRDMWLNPGLSTMWSKIWHGYNRRWLYLIGWVGIGENLLGLTHTGCSSHSAIPPRSTEVDNSLSLSNPIPTPAFSQNSTCTSKKRPRSALRRMSTRLIVTNLIKSFLVFWLSGLNHDMGTVAMIIKNYPRDRPIYLADVFKLTRFFVLQPIGLTIEALFKRCYRSLKVKCGITKGCEPSWSVVLERAFGFLCTWIWLGWSAGSFVRGVAELGMFARDGGRELHWSLFGGVFWGRWYI